MTLREGAEQAGAATVGVLGITVPNLMDIADIAQALTIIFSFVFIVIPTGVWACCRAYQAIRKVIGK